MITHFPKAQPVVQYYIRSRASDETLQSQSFHDTLKAICLAYNAICYKNQRNNNEANLLRDVCSLYVPSPKQRQYMIGILYSEEQGTRGAVTPSGEEDSPAEGEKLNPFSEL
jgi:hypothetical protein